MHLRPTLALLLTCGLAFAPGHVLAQAQPQVQPAPAPAAAPAAPAAEHDDAIFRPFGLRAPLAKKPGALRLATYNVENLFDDKDDPALDGQNEDREQTKPDDACKAVASTITLLDADIIALEEVESIDALKWFLAKYLPESPYKFVSSIDAGDDRGIEQAVLSKFPITTIKNWPKTDLEGTQPETVGRGHNALAGQPMKAHRSPLMVEVSVPSADATAAPYQLTLFVVHMKSGRDFGFWREAESKKLLSLIAETTKDRPDRNIAVLGDFNAADDAASIAILKSGGLTDLSPTGKSSPGKPDKATISHASGRTIDHLMVNANLLKEIVPASEFVLGTPTRPEGTDYRNTPTPPGYASDHFPVVVDLIPKD